METSPRMSVIVIFVRKSLESSGQRAPTITQTRPAFSSSSMANQRPERPRASWTETVVVTQPSDRPVR